MEEVKEEIKVEEIKKPKKKVVDSRKAFVMRKLDDINKMSNEAKAKRAYQRIMNKFGGIR